MLIETVDESSLDGSGWARFSRDRTQRFRLGRAISGKARDCVAHGIRVRNDGCGGFETTERYWPRWVDAEDLARVVFLMLNPSNANAFKPDNTVSRCIEFATLWGADVIEVVNLFAWVSPYPEDLYQRAQSALDVGANMTNDDAIRDACTRPKTRVIAAWGRHGRLNGRAEYVREMLLREHIMLEALDVCEDGSPRHPLARGKHFIPYTKKPKLWP